MRVAKALAMLLMYTHTEEHWNLQESAAKQYRIHGFIQPHEITNELKFANLFEE